MHAAPRLSRTHACTYGLRVWDNRDPANAPTHSLAHCAPGLAFPLPRPAPQAPPPELASGGSEAQAGTVAGSQAAGDEATAAASQKVRRGGSSFAACYMHAMDGWVEHAPLCVHTPATAACEHVLAHAPVHYTWLAAWMNAPDTDGWIGTAHCKRARCPFQPDQSERLRCMAHTTLACVLPAPVPCLVSCPVLCPVLAYGLCRTRRRPPARLLRKPPSRPKQDAGAATPHQTTPRHISSKTRQDEA